MQPAVQLLQRLHLATQGNTDASRRWIGGDDLFHHLRDLAERCVVDVCSDGDRARHVVAVILADDSAFADFSNVAQRHGRLVLRGDGQVAQVLEAFHHGLRHLNLEGVTDTCFGVRPEIGDGEPAAGGGCDEAARGITHFHTEQARAFTVYLHIDTWIIQRLAELHVAQFIGVGEFRLEQFGMRAAGSEIFATDCHFDRRGRSEGHDATDDVRRLKGEEHVWKFPGQACAEFFTQLGNGLAAGLELDLQHGLLGTAVPLVDEIDGIVRGMHADERHAGGDGRLLGNDGQRAQCDLLGGFEPRGGWGAESKLQLAGIDLREYLRSEHR